MPGLSRIDVFHEGEAFKPKLVQRLNEEARWAR